MNCSQFKTNILTFSEDMLSGDLKQRAEQHAETCPECSVLLSQFKAINAIILEKKAAEPGHFVSARIMQGIENEFKKEPKRQAYGWIRVLQPVSVAAALACGILIGSYTAGRDNPSGKQLVKTAQNIEFLRSNLYISDFADEDKSLVINK
ncbi:MAG: anti-sigma factor family protein [Bacteroidales bacterium]